MEDFGGTRSVANRSEPVRVWQSRERANGDSEGGQAWTRIDLVRHGRVAERWRGHIYGDLDVELSEAGREQSRRVARIFRGSPLTGVLSSGLQRSLYGAQEIAREAGLPSEALRIETRFRELHRGDWAGFGRQEVEQREPGGWRRWETSEGMLVPPGAETHEQLRQRVVAALGQWAASHAGEHWALVAHKWVLRAALGQALGMAVERWPRLEVPTSGVVSLLWPAQSRASQLPVEGAASEGAAVGGAMVGEPAVGEVRILGVGVHELPA